MDSLSRRPLQDPTASSAPIFLVLRRMRAPLIVLITTFSVGVGGMVLVPGVDERGQPWRMDVFDAFYFMSYTASTIGYGEIPHSFSTQQRLWVTICIYLTVIAWAYAIGTVFALLQDRGFRAALAAQRFTGEVARLREPFLLMVGYGQAGQLLGRWLDDADRRFVVLDLEQEQIDSLDLASYRSDVPGHVGDARNPHELVRAGLGHPNCEGVVALTDDDEANLAVVMTAALMRPGLTVVARTMDQSIADRMASFGHPMIVNPFDLFGDELMLSLQRPHTHRLVQWLTSSPGEQLPSIAPIPRDGRWVVCGSGSFGGQLEKDLERHHVPVTILGADPDRPDDSDRDPNEEVLEAFAAEDLGDVTGFAAATENDTTNLSLAASAKRRNPRLFLVARQNWPGNAPLFDRLGLDAVLVPTRLIAHEVLARIGSPLMWQFVQQARQEPDDWGQELTSRLVNVDGGHRPEIWKVTLDAATAPAAQAALADGRCTLRDVLCDPVDRDQSIDAAVLLVKRGAATFLTPDADFVVHRDDELLLAGAPTARGPLSTTLSIPSAFEYVTTGHRVANSWAWRRLVDRD